MRGVSEVIAIILILMITISLAGLAYMFMSTTMADVTASAGSTVDTTTSSMMTSFTIESIDIAKVYVRNTGQNPLTSLSVYVNDEPATYNITPISIASGETGTITIYSFIPDGAAIKITSPSGFAALKTANPCIKAVGCWKFDETDGNVVYDSSPFGNTGRLFNGASFASGKYGGSLAVDGVDDFVGVGTSDVLNITGAFTIEVIARTQIVSDSSFDTIVSKFSSPFNGWFLRRSANSSSVSFNLYVGGSSTVGISGPAIVPNSWTYYVGVFNGTAAYFFVNSVLAGTDNSASLGASTSQMTIGSNYGSNSETWNGNIDEVRIYNRAIY